MAAPYKLHAGNSTTRSLHEWNERTKREYGKDVRARLARRVQQLRRRGRRPPRACLAEPAPDRLLRVMGVERHVIGELLRAADPLIGVVPGLQNSGAEKCFLGYEIGRVRTGCLFSWKRHSICTPHF